MSSPHLPRLGADPASAFPPTRHALRRPNGLLAWGGDLAPQRLLAAYRLGIFPWYSEGEPILWWSPAPRCVIVPGNVHLSRRTRRRYNTALYHVTADLAFEQVIGACAEPRHGQHGTWISTEMQRAYSLLHQAGHAHSVEVWRDNHLAGGIYGLALGRMFFGESMFSRETDASKIALVALCKQLQRWDFGLLDCQVPNPHLASLGAMTLPRQFFEQTVQQLVQLPFNPGSWSDHFEVSSRW
ncbi:MAG TPA: leucyl/phenylalanyl-tRNA--protein transferase [Xanthomonadales bacterium]|nr:leucyl/phenylalanyl-tRNA--protein transferase [Xanthomonadales bacterium]